MFKMRNAAISVGVLFGLSLVLFTQRGLTAMQAGTDLILVPVSVTDSKNVPITTLKKEDFQLLEENKEQPIVQFTPATDPITMGVVLSLSARGPIKSPGQNDHISVDILKAVDRVREAYPAGAVAQSPFDSDAMFDVVSKSVDALSKQPGPKKALVVVSDGVSASGQGSVPLPRALIETSKVSSFPIYFLFPTLSSSPTAFTEGGGNAVGFYLEQMAEFSGGQLVTGVIETDLSKVSAELRDRVKSLYVLGFKPANTAKDGKWRKLAVKVTTPGAKYKISGRSRYFVPKG